MTDTPPVGIDRSSLLSALNQLASGFESSDPHISREAQLVAMQNISEIARNCSTDTNTEDGDLQ